MMPNHMRRPNFAYRKLTIMTAFRKNNLRAAFFTLGLLLAPALFAAQQARVLEIRPNVAGAEVEANQVFLLRLSRAPSEAVQAYCNVEGIRSGIPVAVLDSSERKAALQLAQAEDKAEWVALRCKTRFPDAARVSIAWRNAERAVDRKRDETDSWDGQVFRYTARSELPFNLLCSRENEGAGCNPLGQVTLRFTAALDPQQAQAIHLKDSRGRIYRPRPVEETGYHDGAEIRFARLPAASVLTLALPSPLKDFRGNAFRTTPAQPYRFKMAAYPPLVKFAADFGIIERHGDAALPITLRNLEPALAKPGATEKPNSDIRAQVRTQRLHDDMEIMRGLAELRAWQRNDGWRRDVDWYDDYIEDAPDGIDPRTRRPSVVPEGADARGYSMLKARKGIETRVLPKSFGPKTMEVVGLPLPKPGFYLVEAESRKLGNSLLGANKPMFVRTGALVTNLSAHLHYSDAEALIWVTTLDRAKPVADAEVRVRDCKGKLLLQGATDAQGVAHLRGALPQQQYNCPLFAFAEKGDDLTFVRSDWTRGIETWRFHIEEWQAPSKLLGHSVLARNLLRPGETLHMKHYLRQATAQGLSYPAADTLPASVDIIHQGSGERQSVPVTWDKRGSAATVWKLPAGLKHGHYQVQLGRYGQSASFRVEDFRLPVLKSEVLLPKGPNIAPESVPIDLRLSYLSGGAAGNERVTLRHRIGKASIQFPQYPEHVFGEAIDRWSYWYRAFERDPEEEVVTEIEDTGEDKAITLNAQGSARTLVRFAKPITAPKVLIADMEYRDPNGETYTAQARTTLWPSAYAIGIKSDAWASLKDKASAELLVLDAAGKPVAGVPVQATASQHGWISHRKRTVGGFYSYHHEEVKSDLGEVCKGKTDKQGRLPCNFKIAMTGELVLQASVADAQGRAARASSSMWAFSGEDSWFQAENHDRIDLIPENKKYEPGEIAKLQVRTPFKQATVLVGVMRSGGVVDYFTQTLSNKHPVIELPVKPEYTPNVYITAFLVRGRVAAPAATALVDLARPAFKLGVAEINVGARKHEMQVNVKTDKPAYQTREKARVSIHVEGALDAQGKRTLPAERDVTLFAIDEALLELQPNDTWKALATMLAKRGYGFQSASAQMQVIGKRHYGRKALPPGGGGGKLPTRELFDTLLVWQTQVRLNDQGDAQVEVPLNDSLTRFRIVAVADGEADQFGVGFASVTASRDLQVLSALPPVVREADRFTGQFTVRNTTEREMRVKASGKAGVQALTEQQVSLTPGQAKLIGWQVTAPLNIAALEWQVAVEESGGRNDSIKFKQRVEPALSELRFESTAFDLKGKEKLDLVKPNGAVAGKGQVLVSISPKLGTSAASVREYMQSYPFFCLEQRTSKAVSLRDESLWAIIRNSIGRYVTPSGLVTYYPTDSNEGYDVLTSFVLSATHEAGWEIPREARERMLAGLSNFVSGKLTQRYDYYRNDSMELTERKILALDALSRYNYAAPELAESLQLDLSKLSTHALTVWVRTVNRSAWPRRDALLQPALAELKQRYRITASGLELRNQGHEDRWWLMYASDVTVVKLILTALDVPALQADLDGIVRGAIARQHHGHWQTTQANVWGSLALDKYALHAAKSQLSGKTVVRFGGQSREVDWAASAQGEHFVLPFTTERGTLRLEHQGKGVPYVQVLATGYGALHQPSYHGIKVEKTLTPVKQATPGEWRAGDIVKVSLRFKLDEPQGWVVVSDPIPSGATLLGGGLKQAAPQAGTADTKRWRWDHANPMFIERTFTFYRAYYEYLPYRGEQVVEYEMRLNNPGNFNLPPTHVEAMYAPQVYADTPNRIWEVK